MTLFRQHLEVDALAYAKAGGQALHVLGLTPARLYDQDLPRLVATAHELGQRAVYVARTGTPRQHVVISGFPLMKACLRASEATGVVMVDILKTCEVPS